MATTGSKAFTVSASDASAGGTVAWTNHANALASDNTYATCSLADATTSHSLNVNTVSGGWGVPAGATIDGAIVLVHRKGSAVTAVRYVRDNEVTIIINSAHGTNKATATAWPTTEAIASYGSSSDLWGHTQAWWQTYIGSAGAIGVVVQAIGVDSDSIGNVVASVDYIEMEVFYTVQNRRRSVIVICQ
ncbi:MAG: large repetitive protein [Fimbriimonadaceae bacterium]|jgi:hypothetical protein|nr:large repetitive protein [Fimbriimonadaceae bacterium]